MSSIIQISLIGYCFWMFARQYGSPGRERTHSSASNTALYPPDRKRVAWREIRDVLSKQWRIILTALMVANLTIFFGMVFIQDTAASQAPLIGGSDVPKTLDWITCLMESDGNSTSCLSAAPRLGIAESRATATFLLAAVSPGNIRVYEGFNDLISNSSSVLSFPHYWSADRCFQGGNPCYWSAVRSFRGGNPCYEIPDQYVHRVLRLQIPQHDHKAEFTSYLEKATVRRHSFELSGNELE